MPLVSGATAAGFNIVRLLGGGQIGELYLAEHPRLPRQYALKILPADVSADPEYRFRFHQESDRAATLWHPNLVGLHDRGEFDDQLWLAMDYVDGSDAAQLLIETYPDGMPPDMVIEIVSAVADALDYAHEQGLVHRYVNPSNILITDSASGRRRISLAGFGVARRPDETNSLTRANLAIGTVSYAAPEQLMDDSIDGQADQYALACTAFHLLTGWPPFAHMNPAVVVSKHLNGASPRPSDVKPELIRFDTPFVRALMKSPAERFPRCREFAKALAARGSAAVSAPPAAEVGDAAAPPDVLSAAEVDDVVAPPDVLPEAEVDDASRRRRMLHTTALGITILAVALGGIVGVMALRSASQSDDAPTNADTLSSVTTTAPARPAPATAIPPPIVKAPAPRTTQPPTLTASRAATVTPTATSSWVAQTTVPQTTRAHSPTQTTVPQTTSAQSPTSTTTLDSRPAVGMPCGAPGSTTTSNSGIPVACVNTPGGSAWEPPGG